MEEGLGQTCTVPSSLAEAIWVPSGDHAMDTTRGWSRSDHPSSACAIWTFCHEGLSQISTNPRTVATAQRFPSGDQATTDTASVCKNDGQSLCPVAAFQTCTVRSSLAEAISVPSGDQDNAVTRPVWPA